MTNSDKIAALHQWQCRKVIKAAVIGTIGGPGASGDRMVLMNLVLLDGSHQQIEVTIDFMLKQQPEVGGYFVVYDDGFSGFTPKEAFESCYSPFKAVTGADIIERFGDADIFILDEVVVSLTDPRIASRLAAVMKSSGPKTTGFYSVDVVAEMFNRIGGHHG